MTAILFSCLADVSFPCLRSDLGLNLSQPRIILIKEGKLHVTE